MSIQFFAMPEEQCFWLREQIVQLKLWCWVRPGRGQNFLLGGTESFRDVNSKSGEVIDYNLGDSNISEPVFEHRFGRNELNFARSQCVQFSPSKLVNREVLLQGDMGISPRWAYDEAGISDERVRSLYKRLMHELKGLMSRQYLVTQLTTNGDLKEWRDMYVTPAAREFWSEGGLLKQFIAGPVTFGVGERTRKHQ